MKEEKRWISSKELFSAIDELLAEHKQAVFTVTGMSMWPFICHGRDQVIITGCNSKEIKKGDIVLFETILGNYMLHRITNINEYWFETTGDGNCFSDGYFENSCIHGKVVKIIRKGKTIDCDSLFWQMIFQLWMLGFPIRKYLLAVLKKISTLKTKVKR